MSVTLKGLKIHKGMSEETTCFEANVLFEGKLVAHASNRGKGGCTDVFPALGPDESKYPAIKALYEKAEAWVKTQPDLIEKEVASLPSIIALREKRGESVDPNPLHKHLESYVDELVEFEVRSGPLRRAMAKAVKQGMCFGAFAKGNDFMSVSFERDNRAQVLSKYPEAVILTDLSEEAALSAIKALCFR